MNQDEIKALFDQQAAGYDSQWEKTSSIRDCLHLLLESMLATLPESARILCIGVGTGKELIHLAQKKTTWQFTAIEPSSAMLKLCRENVENAGIMDRCNFHEGFLESYDGDETYDAATCFLVSQFILETNERSKFFEGIANRLKTGAVLFSTDLASDINSMEYEVLLNAWMHMMSDARLETTGFRTHA